MKKWWGLLYIATLLFWLGWSIYGTYHFIVRNEIDASFVLAVVGIGITVNTLLNESRSRGIEKQIEGLATLIRSNHQNINQRITDHLQKHP